MTTLQSADGVTAMVPREKMRPSARKLRDLYACVPEAPFFQKSMGFFCLEKWYEQGLDRDADLNEFFGFDTYASYGLCQLGGCEPAFSPVFEEKILEDRGRHELVQDWAGRKVLCFKGRRSGFMPEYLDHPVKDMATWERDCKWRLDPNTPARYTDLEERMTLARAEAAHGAMIGQSLVGGYMYLRSLIGPVNLLYAFYDTPELIHDCMKRWFELADAVIAHHQQYVTLDVVQLEEDITYNHGPLISPDMIKEFLFPYYQQLVINIKTRQLDQSRHLYVELDTDGYAPSVFDLYIDAVGLAAAAPFEVASGCDVVTIGKDYPNMVIFGGIDKRILATTKDQINRHLDAIFPIMHKRGGYCPTCDHGVPEEVSLDNYIHFRKRCRELGE